MQQRNDFFDWDKTPDSNVLPSGDFQMHVEKIDDGESKGGKDGIVKRMFGVQLTVEEPMMFRGMSIFENLVVGSAEAPFDMVPGSMGARSFKQLCKATQIPAANSVQQLLVTLNNAKPMCMVRIVHYVEKDGDYIGTERNRVVKYMKLGEAAPALAPAPGQPQALPSPMAAPVSPVSAVPATPAAAVVPNVAPLVVPPAAPPQAVGAQPEAVPPTAVAPAAPPIVPVAVVPPTPGVPPATGVAAQQTRCTICQADVLMSDLQTHVQGHIQRGEVS